MKLLILLLVSLGLWTAPAGGTAEPTAGGGASTLESRSWIVVWYRGDATLVQPVLSWPDSPAGGPITIPPPRLTFAGGVLSASPGCGVFWDGLYDPSGSTITIRPGGYFLRGSCPTPLIEQASLLMKALARVRRIGSDATRFETSPEVGLVVLEGERGEAEVVLAPIGTTCPWEHVCSAPGRAAEVR